MLLEYERSLVCTVILHCIMYFGVVIPAHSLASGENYASISHLVTSLLVPLVARHRMFSFLFEYCFCVNHYFLPHRWVVSDFAENSMPRTRNIASMFRMIHAGLVGLVVYSTIVSQHIGSNVFLLLPNEKSCSLYIATCSN